MTEKTLDEMVAEALGWKLKIYQPDMGGNHQYIVLGVKVYWCKNFFTKSIANCKRHIEPRLLGNATTLFKDFREVWMIFGFTGSIRTFAGEGKTEEEAYCNALLDLKGRGQNNDKK